MAESINNTEKALELSPRAKIRKGLTSLLEQSSWSEPERRFAGKSASTREVSLLDEKTGSTVKVTETQEYGHILGLQFKVGDPETRLLWTVREEPQTSSLHKTRAEITYSDTQYGEHVKAEYFLGLGDEPEKSPFELDYFYKTPEVYPSPQISFHRDQAHTAITDLLERRIPESFEPAPETN
jgi:hypothetical protein